jgi:hypothetical protein
MLSRAIQDRREGIMGASVRATTAVWQDADAGAAVWVLSNGNLTARRSGVSSVSAISSVPVSSGLRFIQLRATWSQASSVFGIFRISGTPTSGGSIYPGAASGGVGLYGANGNVNANGGGFVAGLSALSLNDVVTIALNANNSTVRFRQNAGLWTPDYTVAGTGDFWFSVGGDGGGSVNSEATILQPSDSAFIRPDGFLYQYSYWI